MKKLLALCCLSVLPQAASAQVSSTVEFDFLFGPTLEVGVTTEKENYFYGSYSYLNTKAARINRAELGWSRPVSENRKHNLGASVGRLEADVVFDLLLIDDIDADVPVVATKYSYYSSGVNSSSVKYEAELLLIDSKLPGISLGIGYKF